MSERELEVRRMSNGGTHYLAYFVYSDALRLTVWGETPSTGKSYTAASGDPANVTVYGRIAPNQNPPAGAYTDNVVATITF
jgi:spore coat protein U-like protein